MSLTVPALGSTIRALACAGCTLFLFHTSRGVSLQGGYEAELGIFALEVRRRVRPGSTQDVRGRSYAADESRGLPHLRSSDVDRWKTGCHLVTGIANFSAGAGTLHLTSCVLHYAMRDAVGMLSRRITGEDRHLAS